MTTAHDVIADTTCRVGEGPLWHPEAERLYWTDIPVGDLYEYDPATGQYRVTSFDRALGGFTIQYDGSLLLFMSDGVVKHWDGDTATTVGTPLAAERDSRFNDVIADPLGRVYCGTMPTDERMGRLYRYDRDGTFTRVREGLDIPNGMGFDSACRRLYLTETEARRIYAAEYDAASGGFTDERVFVEVPADEGVPDGLTVDAAGYVWSAQWNGGCVKRYAPSGELDRTITFPARKVSSVTIGGPALQTAYVTTAGGDDRENEGVSAGAVFAVDLAPDGVRGRPAFRSAVQW